MWTQLQVIQCFLSKILVFLICRILQLYQNLNFFPYNDIIFRTTNLAADYVTLEMMVSETIVGGLIGRCGSNFSRIRSESGAASKVCGSLTFSCDFAGGGSHNKRNDCCFPLLFLVYKFLRSHGNQKGVILHMTFAIVQDNISEFL